MRTTGFVAGHTVDTQYLALATPWAVVLGERRMRREVESLAAEMGEIARFSHGVYPSAHRIAKHMPTYPVL